MLPRFLLDEQFPGALSSAITRRNADEGTEPILFLRVGDPDDLPQGAQDPAILAWADRAGFVVVSADRNTMMTPGMIASEQD